MKDYEIKKKNSLYIYHYNATSVRGKLSDFNSHFSDQEFDIISVAELWLNDSIYDGEILSGLQYNIYRKYRNLKRTSKCDAGGVL